ncbi:alkene reductase [Rhodococcus sovatensis]|uniref:Alkene reductase n=1 Tax=Rhodococcus sovatensis TaxID=1805840 RepID=A0ABZ2PHU6_9NOCA
MTSLFDSHRIGETVLSNRVVMAPMTRARRADCIAGVDTAEYYRQRATAGLMVTEGTPISPEAQGYASVPGIWSAEQVAGWRGVTEAVHGAGGRIFAQLWHVGRMSHTSLQPDRRPPVSASCAPARGPQGKTFAFTEDGTIGFVDVTPPRALSTEEVDRVTLDFVRAAGNAVDAGFDGVELHGANGYLFEQFLNPATNTRTDRYGGSIESRARFLLQTLDALIDAIGSDRVGVRLSPYSQLFDMPPYGEATETYLYLATEFAGRKLAYVHLNDNFPDGDRAVSEQFLRNFRARCPITLILAGGLTEGSAQQLIDDGLIDLAAFGQPFIANPDLVHRLRAGWPLATADQSTMYGGGAAGYTDYPTFECAAT